MRFETSVKVRTALANHGVEGPEDFEAVGFVGEKGPDFFEEPFDGGEVDVRGLADEEEIDGRERRAGVANGGGEIFVDGGKREDMAIVRKFGGEEFVVVDGTMQKGFYFFEVRKFGANEGVDGIVSMGPGVDVFADVEEMRLDIVSFEDDGNMSCAGNAAKHLPGEAEREDVIDVHERDRE